MNKGDLSQKCKSSSTYKIQSYDTSMTYKTKIHVIINRCRKVCWQNPTRFHGKNTQPTRKRRETPHPKNEHFHV